VQVAQNALAVRSSARRVINRCTHTTRLALSAARSNGSSLILVMRGRPEYARIHAPRFLIHHLESIGGFGRALSAPRTFPGCYQPRRSLDRYRDCLHVDDPALLDIDKHREHKPRRMSSKSKLLAHSGTSECSVLVMHWPSRMVPEDPRTSRQLALVTRSQLPSGDFLFVCVCCATRRNLFAPLGLGTNDE
jgi:hypothetical protein